MPRRLLIGYGGAWSVMKGKIMSMHLPCTLYIVNAILKGQTLHSDLFEGHGVNKEGVVGHVLLISDMIQCMYIQYELHLNFSYILLESVRSIYLH